MKNNRNKGWGKIWKKKNPAGYGIAILYRKVPLSHREFNNFSVRPGYIPHKRNGVKKKFFLQFLSYFGTDERREEIFSHHITFSGLHF